MSHPKEESFLRVLRWMREEVELASSVYRTKAKSIAIDPAVRLDGEGNPKRMGSGIPADVDDWFLNAATGLLCCCYMDALGKVIVKGKGGYRLNTFAKAHMPDLVAECDAKGGKCNLETLYTVYRCGFVHQFASAKMLWARKTRGSDYWFSDPDGRPGLNVDRLAEGVVSGIDRFETWFRSQVAAGQMTFVQFFEWLDME